MLCKNKVLYKTEELYFENMMSKRAYRAMYDGWSGNFRRNVMPLVNEDTLHRCTVKRSPDLHSPERFA